jgi:hypothetical protein
MGAPACPEVGLFRLRWENFLLCLVSSLRLATRAPTVQPARCRRHVRRRDVARGSKSPGHFYLLRSVSLVAAFEGLER